MKYTFKIDRYIFIVFALFLLQSCKKEVIPTLSTSTITNITATSASSGGHITSDGGANVTERGVCWSINSDPTINNSKTIDGDGGGSFTSSLVGLSPNTTFYVRAYATNSAGTAYGNQVSFQTLTIPVYQRSIIGNATPSILEITYDLPLANIVPSVSAFTVIVNSLERVVSSIAISGTKILLTLSSQAVYGDILTVAYSKPSTNPIQTTSGVHADSFSAKTVTNNITPPIPVYVSSSIENTAPARLEITYSLTLTNIVPASSAFTVTVNSVTRVVSSIAILGTKVLLTLANPVVYDDVVTLAYTKPSANPIQTSSGGQAVSFSDKNVINNVNQAGSGIIFNPNLKYGLVSDIDGNIYKTIQIGTQTWMAENLKTTKYSDGSPIPNVTNNTEWENLNTPAYSWYNNDISYKADYGALYNWYSVNSGKLCPIGWHVPNITELHVLCDPYKIPEYEHELAGNELMETGINHWSEPLGTNETGFTAVPGGLRSIYFHGDFGSLGGGGTYWSSTYAEYYPPAYALFHAIPYSESFGTSPMKRLQPCADGLSVRCMMNKDYSVCSVSTIGVSDISRNTATSGGSFTCDEGVPAESYGVCWSTEENPTIADRHTVDGTITGTFSSKITGLSLSTKYYVRAYVVNRIGTAYGNQVSFTALSAEPIVFNPELTYGTVADVEGNVYKTIQIGTQTWMAENLKTTKYNDNTLIPNITDNSTWANLSTDAYCWYFNEESIYKPVYGALYNWYAVNKGKLCPTGWHVPSDAEWHSLVLTLDANAQSNLESESEIAGGKLKETGIRHWQSPNFGATNESGFTAIPGGLRDWKGEYGQGQIYDESFYWSTTAIDSTRAYIRMMMYANSYIFRQSGVKFSGLSVRCLKD
jgi:uncharacterized protein (TIGR02145 family)/uncharacterized repeat protein (TIGR02059 family)